MKRRFFVRTYVCVYESDCVFCTHGTNMHGIQNAQCAMMINVLLPTSRSCFEIKRWKQISKFVVLLFRERITIAYQSYYRIEIICYFKINYLFIIRINLNKNNSRPSVFCFRCGHTIAKPYSSAKCTPPPPKYRKRNAIFPLQIINKLIWLIHFMRPNEVKRWNQAWGLV